MAGEVVVLNPNSSAATTAAMVTIAARCLPGYTVRGTTAAHGPSMITRPDELAAASGAVVALGEALAETASVAAVIVAAFGDPGVERLRERVAVPVVGIGEAAVRAAGRDGRLFAVATTTPALVEHIRAMVVRLGFAQQLTGVEITAGAPGRLADDTRAQTSALRTAVDRAASRGAGVVVIGGGPLSTSAEELSRTCAVPVLNPLREACRAVAEVQGRFQGHP